MDADGADRPEDEAVGEPGGPPSDEDGADGGLRTAVLVVTTLAVLVGGGWWWRAEAPRTGPVPAAVTEPSPRFRTEYVPPSEPGRGATFRVDPGTGAAFRVDPTTDATALVDPVTGETRRVQVGADGADGRRAAELAEGTVRRSVLDSFPDTVWTERVELDRERRVVREAAGQEGARHLLQYRCVGPGELVVVIDGARSADRFRSSCDGTVASTEVVGAGGPFVISLATADSEPLRVDAQLVALP